MTLSVPRCHLLGTFTCYREKSSEKEASINMRPLNYSDIAIADRVDVSCFTTVYSEQHRSVSVFSSIDPYSERMFLTAYNGNMYSCKETCATFKQSGCRLFCPLANSAAEVCVFATRFPHAPITARGYVVAAKTARLIKLCLVDQRIGVRSHDFGKSFYPHRFRHTLLSQDFHPKIGPGFLFVHVTLWKNQFPCGDLVIVAANNEEYHVPSALLTNLHAMYDVTAGFPPHMMKLLEYFHMRNNVVEEEEEELVEDAQLENFLEYLEEEGSLEQITEVLVAAIDLLSKGILGRIFEMFGRKIDDIDGGALRLEDYARLLGFIVWEGNEDED